MRSRTGFARGRVAHPRGRPRVDRAADGQGFAHFAIELELPIRKGYWGCVAAGASLSGRDIAGTEAELAETLAGPIQTLMRTEAGQDAYAKLLTKVSPADQGRDLAARVHERVRQLRGRWQATACGSEMNLEWPE